MAQDNAAQAIKDLQKNLEELDKQLFMTNKNFELIGNTIVKSMKEGMSSVDDLYKVIASKLKAKDVLKMKVIVDKEHIEEDINKLKSAINRGVGQIKIGENLIRGKEQMKSLLADYEAMLKQLPKDSASAFDYVMQTVNSVVGGKNKESKGTALGRARAKEMEGVANTTKKINDELARQKQLEDAIAKIRERGGRGAKFEGEYKSLKSLNQMLDESRNKTESLKRTLAGYGGRGRQALSAFGGDGSATALKKQEQNFRKLNMLLNERRKLEAQIASQGGKANETQTRYQHILNAEIKNTVTSMRELGKRYDGVTRQAAKNTMEERARRTKKTIDSLNGSLKQTRKDLSSMMPLLQRLGSAFGIAFSVRGLVQFGKKLIETRGEFELQQVALRSILQNKQLADEIWDKTMQAALKSPFTAMQLTKYTKQLAAYRIETNKLFDTTKRLADVSAGLGVDMQRLILAYGQVKAANYLRASEIRQFTEAGVNILGELSEYFSRTREGMYDTAKVMDMVTKRLVTFSDVEAIFKRMTDEGGIFFDMQYVQSQTVKGQIAKLHDAYDQMLNSIGQANEGVLKNMVSLLNNIVKNWREFKTVIDIIAWPILISLLYKFSLGLMAVDAATIATATSMNAATVAGARLQLVFKKLWAIIAANPWLALASAILAVAIAARNHAKNVDSLNKKYEDLMSRTYDTQKNLNGYSSSLQKNMDTMKTAKKGSDEYNKALNENDGIIAKLKNDYPDLLKDIDLQKEGYQKLIEKIKEYNEELEDQIRLEYAARASFWQDDLTTNIVDLQEAQRKREMDFLKNRNKAELNYLRLKAEGKEEEENIWWKRIRLAKDWKEQVDIINEQNKTIYEEQQKASQSGNEGIVFSGNWSLQSQGFVIPSGVEKKEKDIEQNIYDEALVFNEIIKKQLRTINEDLGEDIQQFIEDNKTQVDELFKDKEGEGWKLINKRITKFFTAKGATDKESREAIQRMLNQYLLIPIQLDWSGEGGGESSTTPPQTTTTNKTKENASKLISLIREMRSEYDKLSKSAYGYAKSETTVREAYKDSVKEILGKAGITDYDFTTNEGMIAALEKVKAYATKLGKDAAAEVQKYIDQLETEITINAQVKIRDNFVKDIEKMFNDYQLTLELQQLNISSEAAKDLFPEFDAQSLGQLQDALNDFYKKQGASFDEEDLKVYKQWSDKIDAEILKSRKERAKEYSKYLEKEYSERAKVEMQYAKDVAFVSANFKGEQQQNILKGIEEKYQQDLSELTWKSFKESAFYVEMMDDLSSVPMDYMKIMLGKIEELLANPQTLSPRALKEAINARQKILEAQMDFDQVAVMKESMAEIREAATDVGGATWSQTKKRLDEEQKAQAEKLKGLEEEIRCYEELQGQLKGLEQHDEAVAAANKALPEDVVSMLEGTDIDTLISQYSSELESLSVSEDATTSAEKDENAQIQAKIEYLQRVIPLLEAYRTALNARAAYQETDAGQNALFARQGGETSTSVGATITETKGEANKTSNRLATLKKWQKAFTNFNNSFARFNKNAADMVGRLGSLASAAFDLYDALGGETDAMTEAWKEFGSTIVNVITQALTMIPSLVAGFVTAGTTINAAMGIIGLIAEAIQLVLVLIGALAKLHDAGYEKEIENQQKKIDSLQRAYERLEKAIEKTWDTASYIRTYNEETQNLYERIEATNRQIAAEQAKKNSDADKIQGYKDSVQDMEDELDDLKQKQIETFGGIGEQSYRSAAEEFVDAWKSAFLETGDGLSGLEDHFDEFLQSWFTKQATMRVTQRMLEPLFRQIDTAVDQYGLGGANVLASELADIKERASVIFPQLSQMLEDIAGTWGLEGEGSLSGLAAGIQGMTEEQANILEAYWNSVRGYTASIDQNVAAIVSINSRIDSLLQSVSKGGHGLGGSGIKVFVN